MISCHVLYLKSWYTYTYESNTVSKNAVRLLPAYFMKLLV